MYIHTNLYILYKPPRGILGPTQVIILLYFINCYYIDKLFKTSIKIKVHVFINYSYDTASTGIKLNSVPQAFYFTLLTSIDIKKSVFYLVI